MFVCVCVYMYQINTLPQSSVNVFLEVTELSSMAPNTYLWAPTTLA